MYLLQRSDTKLQCNMHKINAQISVVFMKIFEKYIGPLQSLLHLSPVPIQQNKSGLKNLLSHFTIPQNNFKHFMPLVFLQILKKWRRTSGFVFSGGIEKTSSIKWVKRASLKPSYFFFKGITKWYGGYGPSSFIIELL